jgi:hypothetical protein
VPKTPVDYRKPLKSRLQQSVNRLSIPKKKEGGGTPTAIANMSASEVSGGGDLGNTSLILSTNVNRASTPQPLNAHIVSDSNHNNNNNSNQNPSETTSGISSNTSSGSSLNKKVK